MREASLHAVADAVDTDERVALVLADISAGTDPVPALAARHPDRVLNVGIREQLMIGVAGGLALAGLRPVAHSYAPFLVERPYEGLKLDLGHQDVGAVLVSVGASYDVPGAGRTHEAPEDVALLDTLPGWTVHVPGHPDEADRLVRDAALGREPDGEGRVYIRLSDATNAAPHPGDGLTTIRRGRDGVVVAVGPTLDATLEAVDRSGRDLTVLYTTTPRPFDTDGLRAAVDDVTDPTVTMVEPYLAGTSARVVAEALADRPHRQVLLGARREELRRYGTRADHDAAHGLDAAGIAAALRE